MRQNRQIVLLTVLFEGGLAGSAWGLGWLLRQPALASFHWNGSDIIVGIIASVPMLGMFLALLRWPVGPLVHTRRSLLEIVRPLFRRCTLAELGIISLLAGVGEEMLFRGVLQGTISRWIRPEIGLLAASALFGLAHLITPMYALAAGLMGIYLGWLWQVSDNLMTPIVTHAVYDFLALCCLLRFRSFYSRAADFSESP